MAAKPVTKPQSVSAIDEFCAEVLDHLNTSYRRHEPKPWLVRTPTSMDENARMLRTFIHRTDIVPCDAMLGVHFTNSVSFGGEPKPDIVTVRAAARPLGDALLDATTFNPQCYARTAYAVPETVADTLRHMLPEAVAAYALAEHLSGQLAERIERRSAIAAHLQQLGLERNPRDAAGYTSPVLPGFRVVLRAPRIWADAGKLVDDIPGIDMYAEINTLDQQDLVALLGLLAERRHPETKT